MKTFADENPKTTESEFEAPEDTIDLAEFLKTRDRDVQICKW